MSVAKQYRILYSYITYMCESAIAAIRTHEQTAVCYASAQRHTNTQWNTRLSSERIGDFRCIVSMHTRACASKHSHIVSSCCSSASCVNESVCILRTSYVSAQIEIYIYREQGTVDLYTYVCYASCFFFLFSLESASYQPLSSTAYTHIHKHFGGMCV